MAIPPPCPRDDPTRAEVTENHTTPSPETITNEYGCPECQKQFSTHRTHSTASKTRSLSDLESRRRAKLNCRGIRLIPWRSDTPPSPHALARSELYRATRAAAQQRRGRTKTPQDLARDAAQQRVRAAE